MNFKLIGTTTDEVRVNWVIKELKALPEGIRILDAGAGELRFKTHCGHLQYVAGRLSAVPVYDSVGT